MEKVLAATIGSDIPFSPAQHFPTIASLVNVITKNAMILAGVLTFIFIIIGGFGIITGAGDPKKLEQSKKTLTIAIVGFLLVVFSFWIIQLISLVIGFNILQFQGS